ncbi:flagellar biosynthetic protein FliO [uncultured Pseudokineococcus sp.]|uniref:flagellar biosynthetic protein FliO n=1 Tax=uncultured Pseudokineococcus sp. TaxID=1642928 RepID=UPI0026383BD3|nr:flagellar biosynthetic protein FliO [uncultured Pseudokineococcus sp.]
MDTLGLLLRVTCSLAAVLGLVWMVRRGLLRGGGGRARLAVGSITVLARQQLTGRASVALVQVGGTGLVLGVTDSSVQVLASRPVDELLLQPAEPVPAPRPLAARPAGRRLLPTARREAVALPAVLLPAAPAATEVVSPDAAPAAPVAVPTAAPAADALPGVVLDPVPAPAPVAAPGAVAGPDTAPGLEPLYEELRRRALDALPRQERREAPAAGAADAAEVGAPAPPATGFEASLGLELDARPSDVTEGLEVTERDAAPAARHARHARTGPATRPGALSGSALSPATWVQAVDALRERTGRR